MMKVLFRRFVAWVNRKSLNQGLKYTRREIELIRVCVEDPTFMECLIKAAQIEGLEEASRLRNAVASQSLPSASIIEGRIQGFEEFPQILQAIANLPLEGRP